MRKIKISIITVCYQAEAVIEKTIRSVLGQTYPHIEYLVIDGASTDGTWEIVRPYADAGKLIWHSEPDRGIYDAMNKGVRYATGEYVYFLNAGDTLFDEKVFERLAAKCSPDRAEALYGNITYLHPDGHTERRIYGGSCGKRIYYLTGDCVNHQALLAHRACFELAMFDTRNYQICADRDWMMRIQKKKVPFICTGEMIANYSLDAGSASIANQDAYQREAKLCVKKNMPWGYWIFSLFEFCRNNRLLSKMLHGVYRILYIRK